MKRGAEGTGGQWRRNDGSEVEGWIGWGDGMLGVKISGGETWCDVWGLEWGLLLRSRWGSGGAMGVRVWNWGSPIGIGSQRWGSGGRSQ
jgi:hypothetical protein